MRLEIKKTPSFRDSAPLRAPSPTGPSGGFGQTKYDLDCLFVCPPRCQHGYMERACARNGALRTHQEISQSGIRFYGNGLESSAANLLIIGVGQLWPEIAPALPSSLGGATPPESEAVGLTVQPTGGPASVREKSRRLMLPIGIFPSSRCFVTGHAVPWGRTRSRAIP